MEKKDTWTGPEGYKRIKDWIGEGNSPYEIGGRSTDVSIIALSLASIIKDCFPINEVPKNIVVELDNLYYKLKIAEKLIEEFIDFVTVEIN